MAANNTIFNGTIFNNPVQWLKSTTSTNINNNFTNTTFATENGSIQIINTFNLTGIQDITHSKLNISQNNAFLNSTNLTSLNLSAAITLNNITFTNPKIKVDFDDDGIFVDCVEPDCFNLSYDNVKGIFVFNVSSFTSYQAAEIGVDSCQNITNSSTLVADVTAAGTCFNITADDVVLDCGGFRVSYGDGGGLGVGLDVTGRNNITIKECNIRDTNSGGANGFGISLSATNNSLLINNSIQTNGTINSFGIRITANAYNNTITNNTIKTQGSNFNNGIDLSNVVSGTTILGNTIQTNGSSQNRGISLTTDAGNTVITNNTINTNGTGSLNQGIRVSDGSGINISGNIIQTDGVSSNTGISLALSSNNTLTNNSISVDGTSNLNKGLTLSTVVRSTISGNIIQTNGTSDNQGIFLQNIVFNITLTNNTIKTDGTGADNYGMFLDSTITGNNFSGNIIQTNGSSRNIGLRLNFHVNNNSFMNTNISTSGPESYGIHIITSNSSFNGTIFNNPTEWLLSTTDTNINDFGNTTFVSENGSIQIKDTFILPGFQNINSSKLNISQNKAFLNSTNLTFINLSATINLNDITLAKPVVQVDFEDDDSSVSCLEPQCEELSFANNVFVFNVSSFTTYTAVEFTSVCQNLTTSFNVTNDVSSLESCFNITTDDVILDCKGFEISYDSAGIGRPGINVITRTNVTIKNCVIRDINSAGPAGYGINIEGTNNSLVFNNSIQTNGTFNAFGMRVAINSNNNTILNNNISTFGTEDSNSGIQFITDVEQNTVSGNIIQTNGTTNNRGINLESRANNNTIRNNIIKTRGTGASNYGIRILTNSRNNSISGNIIQTNGTTSNFGIFLFGGSNKTIIHNNTINTRGSSNTQIGIEISTNNFNSLITENFINTNGTDGNMGIRIGGTSNNNTFHNNTIITNGSSSGSHGIFLTDSLDNIVSANIIQALGEDQNGISISNSGKNVFFSNNISTNGTFEEDPLSFAVNLGSSQNSTFNNTLFNNPIDWITMGALANATFTNLTFKTQNGSIRLPETVVITGGQDILKEQLNISQNKAPIILKVYDNFWVCENYVVQNNL